MIAYVESLPRWFGYAMAWHVAAPALRLIRSFLVVVPLWFSMRSLGTCVLQTLIRRTLSLAKPKSILLGPPINWHGQASIAAFLDEGRKGHVRESSRLPTVKTGKTCFRRHLLSPHEQARDPEIDRIFFCIGQKFIAKSSSSGFALCSSLSLTLTVP